MRLKEKNKRNYTFVALKFHDTGYSFWDQLHNFFTQIYMNCFVSSKVEQTG